jgi:transcriptional regulator with GAF, ATPase, and Fis domain
MQLLFEVWREACRHIVIGEFVERVAPLVARELPFATLLLRRIELERHRLETLASAQEGRATPRARTECSALEMQEVLHWGRGSEPLSGPGGKLLRVLAPPETRGEMLAGPLAGEHGLGVLVLVRDGKPFTGPEIELFRHLLEPFGAALENDRRFHELTRLREAALAENRALLSRLGRQEISESIVGADSGLVEVMARVEKVASTDAPVLILGETGSGKEVIARALHARSPRNGGPIVRVNCGAIPSELVDSELFGHEKGSFTGAINTHRGWFERADGGTLFLDEIGELPPAAQVRLLRILQDGSFERVGGQQSLSVDVRLVAATHRNLEDMVVEGTFRRDLWYRISVFPIHLPPLRERPADIPTLAAHFAAAAGKRLGSGPLTPSADDLALLLTYDWPGNVRELASVIERAAILGDGRKLEMAAALGRPSTRSPAHAPGAPVPLRPVKAAVEPEPSGASLDAAMRRHIEEALGTTSGRIEGEKGAARLLGINPHTLRARMRKLGIDWQRFRA